MHGFIFRIATPKYGHCVAIDIDSPSVDFSWVDCNEGPISLSVLCKKRPRYINVFSMADNRDFVRVRIVFFLRGQDVVFYASERQVEGRASPEVDTVEVRFRGSKSDRGRKGAVLGEDLG